MKTTGRYIVMISALALSPVACGDGDVLAPGDQSNDRITITNTESALAGRVRYFDQDVAIDPVPGGTVSLIRAQEFGRQFSLTLVAEITPPTIDGQVLQATSVVMRGDIATVSYNVRGAQYQGGIDVFNISARSKPKLLSEALFNDTDINSISITEGNCYAAAASGSSGFADPAVFEVIQMRTGRLVLDGYQRLPLASFAGTAVLALGGTIYTTSGDSGGLSAFDQTSLMMTSSVDLHDARWVDAEGGKLVVVQGTPGQISVYDQSSLSLLGTYSFSGADIPESKSTLEVVGGKAFIAAGTGGVQILSINTGTVVGTVPRPDPVPLGLDPAVVVTNSVAVDENLLFISNGEAGVYVAQGSVDFDLTGSDDPQQITLLGKLRFENLASVNHVAYKGRYLIIASGLGGLKIVKLTVL